jgi:hypothetical protein
MVALWIFDGHVIKEYEAIEHDGYGAIGSP